MESAPLCCRAGSISFSASIPWRNQTIVPFTGFTAEFLPEPRVHPAARSLFVETVFVSDNDIGAASVIGFQYELSREGGEIYLRGIVPNAVLWQQYMRRVLWISHIPGL